MDRIFQFPEDYKVLVCKCDNMIVSSLDVLEMDRVLAKAYKEWAAKEDLPTS